MNFAKRVATAGVLVGAALAASPASATSLIFAFMGNGDCYQLTHGFNRGDSYRFDIGSRKVAGNLTNGRGKELFDDMSEAVANLVGATFLETRSVGVTGVYGQLGSHTLPSGDVMGAQCTGSIESYCFSVEATSVKGSVSNFNYQQAANGMCVKATTGSKFYNNIVNHVEQTRRGSTVVVGKPEEVTQNTVSNGNGQVTATCQTVGKCTHMKLTFGN